MRNKREVLGDGKGYSIGRNKKSISILVILLIYALPLVVGIYVPDPRLLLLNEPGHYELFPRDIQISYDITYFAVRYCIGAAWLFLFAMPIMVLLFIKTRRKVVTLNH